MLHVGYLQTWDIIIATSTDEIVSMVHLPLPTILSPQLLHPSVVASQTFLITALRTSRMSTSASHATVCASQVWACVWKQCWWCPVCISTLQGPRVKIGMCLVGDQWWSGLIRHNQQVWPQWQTNCSEFISLSTGGRDGTGRSLSIWWQRPGDQWAIKSWACWPGPTWPVVYWLICLEIWLNSSGLMSLFINFNHRIQIMGL